MPTDPATVHAALTPAALVERIARIGSWTLALPGQQVLLSGECAAILAQPENQPFTQGALVAAFSPEHRDRLQDLLQGCSARGTAFDEEMQIDVATGLRKWVRAVGEAVRGPRGQIVGLQGVLQDISLQKQAQDETLHLAMRLTTTLASITEAFITLDRPCTFT